jgi:RHS repeat-associated protein
VVTDSTGVSLVSESFTAYGNRREASSWTGAPTSGELTTMNGVTREGYTFQTVLGSMGLNHMNGRVEDAVTGRFLSPDPRTPDRYNTQGWNRYSYVKNNPLSYTDPTGFDDKFCGTGNGCGGDGAQGTPEQSSWSCYGDCSGGVWANSVTSVNTTASSSATADPNAGWSCGGDTCPDLISSASSSSSSSTVNFMAAQYASIVWPSIFAGRAFQSAFNSKFNVLSNATKLFTNVGNTIPDLYKAGNGILELKNGAYIYNSAQIEAQLAAAELEGVPYYLGVSPTSTVTGTASTAVAATEGEVFVFDAATGTMSSYEGGEVSAELLEFLAALLLEE